MEVHDILDDIESNVLEKLNVHLVIHYDPVVTDDPELARIRGVVEEILGGIDERLRTHDFRMVNGVGHKNLIFDISLPTDLRMLETSIKQQLDAELKQREPGTYYTVVTFDPPEILTV